MKTRFTFSLVLLLGQLALQAQTTKVITGRVMDETGKTPLSFATVVLLKNGTDELIKGDLTKEDGLFSIETTASDFYVKITFVGFLPMEFKDIDPSQTLIQLGDISIKEAATDLDDVVVTGEKSQTVFKLDKRVFNVGKDLSSSGASALEVLDNVPSVTVNIEGAISLRGSTGVQMLINGKPSVIANGDGNALGTITADMIESIEVITNPSAKYEAEGTAGIINIILKKEERRGVNGSVTVNTGVPNNHSIGLSLNRRTEKFNLFSQIGVGKRTFPGENRTFNRSLDNSSPDLLSFTDSEKNETFYNFILGTDYHINKLNVITLSGSYAFEQEKEYSDGSFSFSNLSEVVTDEWTRNETTTATNPKWQYELQYKMDFEDNEDRSLLFSAIGNSFGKDQSSEFINTTVLGNAPNGTQEIRTDFLEVEYTFKLDYTHPFSEKHTLEIGAQYQINDVTNDYAVIDIVNGERTVNANLTNIFDYDQKVLGGYATYGIDQDKWGIKLGLRLENTDLQTVLRTTNEDNSQNYNNLFPSVHASYKLSQSFSLQGGYSRRISRPRLWDLNPFFNIRNNFNISTGNPNLLPEFSDSYEINMIHELSELSISTGVYYRYTTDVMEDIATFENGVTTSLPQNIGTNKALGAEVNAKYEPENLKWLSLRSEFNFNGFEREGQFEDTNFDFTGSRWTIRSTAKAKLPGEFDLEVSGNYNSKFRTVQSTISDVLFANLGLRKKIMNGRAIINMSVRDVFASRRRQMTTEQPGFILSTNSFRGRFVSVGFSFGFGKGEAMEFSSHKRF